VGNTVTRVKNDTSGTTGGVKRQDSLDRDIESRRVESLKHNLGHFFAVRLGVERCLSKENRVFLRSNTEFIVEGMMPDLFHVIPVGDNTMLNRVTKGKDTTLGLSFVTDIRVLLSHSDHHTLMAGTADNRREDLS
jgi:hypothetical protein